MSKREPQPEPGPQPELEIEVVTAQMGAVHCAVCHRPPERLRVVRSNIPRVLAVVLGRPSFHAPAVIVCHRCLVIAAHVARWGVPAPRGKGCG